MTSGRQKSTVAWYDTIQSPANVKTNAPACLNYMWHCSWHLLRIYGTALSKGVHKFSKNVETTSKFYMLEEWHEASSIRRTLNPGVTCEPRCYLVVSTPCMWNCTFLCKEKTAMIMLQVSGTNLQKEVPWVFRCLGFLHPCWYTILYVREKLQHFCYKCHNPQYKIHLPWQAGAWDFNTSDSVNSLVLKEGPESPYTKHYLKFVTIK